MALGTQDKLDIINAQKGPLEHELFSAETDLDTKRIGLEYGATGVSEGVVEAALQRYKGIKAQVEQLEAKAEELREQANRDGESVQG